jgi:Glycosyl hydrolases family 28/Carbohydrate binding module (family 6)
MLVAIAVVAGLTTAWPGPGMAAGADAGPAPALVAAGQPGVGPQAVFNVRDYGATGNGSTNDTPAINRAITAANEAGGINIVRFPSGTYRSANSIHMKSNVTLQLDSGSTIRGSGSSYDPPEPNPWDDYQDYGHSHFHNAMIWGDRLTNIGFVGSGTIDGGGALITGNPDSGEADKIISLTRCTNLTVSGITMRRGGHFAMLINGCTNVTSDRLKIDTASDRDGWNVISTTNVRITNADIRADDDALAFKSDYALGQKLPNGNVVVTDSYLSAVCCNALMYGSETCGDFTNYRFERITINGSQKSGLGMVSMDGTVISDVHYRDIDITNVRSPIMIKVGTRRRCGNNPGIGRVDGITYDNITIRGSSPSFSPTIWGAGPNNRVSNVTFNNVHITVPGGNGTMSTDPPSNNATDYNPRSIGTRPAFGWYIRYADNIRFNNSSVRFASNDGRPAVIVNNSTRIGFNDFVAQRGSSSPFDLGFQSSSGQCVTNARNTSGGALRYSPTGAPPSCAPTGDDFSVGVTPSSRTVAPGSSTTYTVNTSVVSGSPGNITLSASGLPAGATASFSPNPVAAGGSSTMTVATSSSTPNGTSALTVTGTGSAGTRTASASLTVGGPQPGNRTEAESGACTISQGAVESNHPGFSGTGFVNYANVSGSYVECTVNAAQAGTATLRFGYANGTTANRPMDIAVGGEVVADELAFPGTGAWTNYQTVTATVTLAAGPNTVRATATTANGGPNLDYLEALA